MKPLEILKKASLFLNLSSEGIDTLLKKGQFKAFKKNDLIFQQNDNSNELFVILEGEVQIQLQPETDDIAEKHMVNPKFIASLSAGDSFGELAVLTKEKRTATARVQSPKASLFICERDQFKEFCLSHPKDGLQLVFNISKKISSIVSSNNRIILEQYFSNHIALLFRNFLVASGVEKNLITPREIEMEITETSNFILPDLSQEKVSKEILKISLYSETEVLQKLASDVEPDLGRIISVLLKTIRKNRSVFVQNVIAKVDEKDSTRKGVISIHKKGLSPFTMNWGVKGAFIEGDTLQASIHLTLHDEQLTPQAALDHYLNYLKMPIQEKVIPLLEPVKNISLIVLHHRTMEVVQSLINFKKLGFTLEAFIGVPYGEIDKSLTHTLDYVSDGRYFTLRALNSSHQKSEFVFDFDSSSQQALETENELRSRFDCLNESSYINSMELLASFILEKTLEKNIQAQKPLLILEDGGYFFPLILNAIQNPKHPLHAIVKKGIETKIFLGIVEGTASGEVRDLKALAQLPETYHTLLPLFSGARDSIKTSYESKGIASSIIESSEVSMRNLGIRTFETRKITVIGGNGAIGTRIIEQLKLLQNTATHISSVDKNEDLYNYVIPDGFKHLQDHILFDTLKRFPINERDVVVTDLKNIKSQSPMPGGRSIVVGYYKNNAQELIQELEKLNIKTNKQYQSDDFLELTHGKERIIFLSSSSIITYPHVKEAILSGVNTLIGVTGTSVFDEIDLDAFFFRDKENDELVLISGSSKDVEFKKGLTLLNELTTPPNDKTISNTYNYFKELQLKGLNLFNGNYFPEDPTEFKTFYEKITRDLKIRKEITENVGSTFYLDINGVKKRIILLADGMVVNFFATYAKGASLDYIDPILTLQLLGVHHLAQNKVPGGFHRISSALKPEILNLLWSSLNDQMS